MKWTRSPRPSVMSPVPSSPAADAAERAGRSEERSGAGAATGPAPTPDLQPEEAPLAVGMAEQLGRSKGQTGARSIRDLQSEDAPPAAPVGGSRAGSRSDPQAGQEPVRTAPTPFEVKGHGSLPGSGPRPIGPRSSESAFRVVPLATRYVSFCCFFDFWWLSLFWSVVYP